MAKFVLLVALALVVSSVQCAAACTPVSCAPQPPCHHHKQAPLKADCHELVPATTVQSFVVSVLFTTEPVDVSPVAAPSIQITHDRYQPFLTGPPHTVLRI